MKRFLFFLVASAVLSSSAGPRLLREWTFEKSNAAVAIRNGGRLFFDPLRDSSGNPVLEIEIPKKTAKYPVVLTFRSETPLKKGRKIEIEFEVRSSLPCRAELQAADAAPPYSHRARSQTFDIPASWKKHRLSFVITSEAREALSLPQILFREVPPGARIDFGPIRVTDVTDAVARPAFYETRAGREWRPVDTSDLAVKAGSALDLSGLVDRSPAGTWDTSANVYRQNGIRFQCHRLRKFGRGRTFTAQTADGSQNERQNVFSCFHENLLQHLFNQPSNHFFPLLNKPFRDRKNHLKYQKTNDTLYNRSRHHKFLSADANNTCRFSSRPPHSSLVPANHQLMQMFKA